MASRHVGEVLHEENQRREERVQRDARQQQDVGREAPVPRRAPADTRRTAAPIAPGEAGKRHGEPTRGRQRAAERDREHRAERRAGRNAERERAWRAGCAAAPGTPRQPRPARCRRARAASTRGSRATKKICASTLSANGMVRSNARVRLIRVLPTSGASRQRAERQRRRTPSTVASERAPHGARRELNAPAADRASPPPPGPCGHDDQVVGALVELHVGLDVVERRDVVAREHLGRRPAAMTSPVAEEDQPIAHGRRQVEVVRREDQADAARRDSGRAAGPPPRADTRGRATPSARRAAAASACLRQRDAMTTRCFSPPLSVENGRAANSSVPVAASASCAMAMSAGPSTEKRPRCG